MFYYMLFLSCTRFEPLSDPKHKRYGTSFENHSVQRDEEFTLYNLMNEISI